MLLVKAPDSDTQGYVTRTACWKTGGGKGGRLDEANARAKWGGAYQDEGTSCNTL